MSRRFKVYGINVNGSASIATTGNTDVYRTVDKSGTVVAAMMSAGTSLTADNTNYITASMTNLGQAGAGSNPLLAASDANTTKATGGSGIVANGKRSLTINATPANLAVVEGDTIRIRYAVTGTLGAAITLPRTTILISASGA
jgi:hypothetical protein